MTSQTLGSKVEFNVQKQAGRVGLALSSHFGGDYESHLRSSILNSTKEQLHTVYSLVDISEDLYALQPGQLFRIFEKFNEINQTKICNYFGTTKKSETVYFLVKKLLGYWHYDSVNEEELKFLFRIANPTPVEIFEELWMQVQKNRGYYLLLNHDNFQKSRYDFYNLFRKVRDVCGMDEKEAFKLAPMMVHRMLEFHLDETSISRFMSMNDFTNLWQLLSYKEDITRFVKHPGFMKQLRNSMSYSLYHIGDEKTDGYFACYPEIWLDFITTNVSEHLEIIGAEIDEYDKNNPFVTKLIEYLLTQNSENTRRASFLQGLKASEVLLVKENSFVFHSIR